ncbi:MAG: mechanosensitive ion channel [Omnitrophica WOR_2 bacterium]
MAPYFSSLLASLVALLPAILLAIVVFVAGLIIAYLASGLVRRLLARTGLEDRIASLLHGSQHPKPENIQVENWIAGIVFWLIVFFAAVAALQILNLNAISGPLAGLLNPILDFIPRLISALILLVIAWVIATILRVIVTRVLSASGLVRQASENADVPAQNRVSIAQTVGNIVYWLVFLLFLPAVLGALQLAGLLGPVQTMVNNILAYLPNILAAFLIFAIGYFVARIVRSIVVNLLASAGLDNVGRRAGMGAAADQVSLSQVIGWIVYVLILIPVIIAALNALNIPSVSTPASNMLNQILAALPNIFAALVVLAIAYFIGRLLGRFVAALLSGLGFNRFFQRLGLFRETGSVPAAGEQAAQATSQTYTQPAAARTTPADIIGYIVTVGIILFAALEAAQILGFAFLATLISSFIVAAFEVLVGLAIFAIGLYLSALADRAIRESRMSQANILAPVARVAIIVFAGALALRQMGIADSIVNLAFGLMLGAVAVAAALAFGLGGRDFAHRQLERWQNTMGSGPILPNTGPDQPGSRASRDRTHFEEPDIDTLNRDNPTEPPSPSI